MEKLYRENYLNMLFGRHFVEMGPWKQGDPFRNNPRSFRKNVVLPGGRMDFSKGKDVESKACEAGHEN